MGHELWPHQATALQSLRHAIGFGNKRIVLLAPTGSGKTRIAAEIVNGAINKGKRVAFVVSNISLIDQTIESFNREGIYDIGVIQANHVMTNWARPIQLVSIQTLKNKSTYPVADIVIIDEVHTLHETHKKWLQHPDWKNVPFVGLSATPYTKGLGKYFTTLIVVATTQQMIDRGVLCPFRVFATGHPDLSGVKTVAGDYHEGQLSDIMQSGMLTADIIKTWSELWGQDRTLCFCVDRAHAQTVCDRFNEAGISCGYQDGNTPIDERRELKKKFHNGDYRVVCNVMTLTTGTDWDVRCLILARPTKSKMLYQQIVGRGLRIAEGKKDLLLLDHTDTICGSRDGKRRGLGFVTDIDVNFTQLDDGTEKKDKPTDIQNDEPPLPKLCPQCSFVIPPGIRQCPNCGHKKTSEIIEQHGELIEITPGKAQPAKDQKPKPVSMNEKAKFLAELKTYAMLRGHKEGWCSHKYKEKFGVWPDHSIQDIKPANEVSITTQSWIKSRMIAWAKRRDRANERVV